MTSKRLLKSILIVTLISAVYYYVHSPDFFRIFFLGNQDVLFDAENTALIKPVDAGAGFKNVEMTNGGSISASEKSTAAENAPKPLEILGGVVDTRHQPIKNVLISEEQYFYNTRTGLKGKYRIFVDLLE